MMKKRPFPPKVQLPKAPPPKKAAKPKPPPVVKKGDVSSISETFAAFFNLCKRRLLPVLAAALLSSAVSLILLAGLCYGLMTALAGSLSFLFDGKVQEMLASPQLLTEHLLPLGGVAAVLLALFLFWSWVYTTMLAAAVDEHNGILESLCVGWKNLFPMLWVNFLLTGVAASWCFIVVMMIPAAAAALSFVVPAFTFDIHDVGMAGGSIIFIAASIISMLLIMLLVISVPFSMSFGFIALLDEGRGGLDALLVSRLYVRGYWWDTFFKMLLMWLLLSALSLPLLALRFFVQFPGQEAVVPLLSLLTMPLMILYMVTVYRDLKKASGKVDPAAACRCLWMPMALAGILLPLLALLGLALTGGPKKMEMLFSRAGGISAPAEEPASPPPAPEVRTLPSVDGFIIWRDPTGDVGSSLLDIREVSALGKEDELRLVVTLARPFADYFAAAGPDAFDPLVKFYFDVDRDQATGAAAGGGKGSGGFDIELDVLLLTGPEKDGGNGNRAYPSLYALSRDSRQSLAPLEDGTAVISGNTLTLRLPYSRVDGTAGGRFRICFLESAQREGGLSREQTVPLR